MTVLEMVLALVATPVVAVSGYLAFLTLLSGRVPAPEPGRGRLRFDVVVPAHDEADGIVGTVTSLLAVDYPRDLFRVVVVADNCTDETAERAHAAGATVLVRQDAVRKGKGFALAHAFDHILADGRSDAVVVVDADTSVSPNLLRAFEARIDAGATAVQADYAVRNPGASWRTRLMAIALAAAHTIRSLARERMRLSVGLHGNGMCFACVLLRSVPYEAFSIVEDLEFSLRLGEAGHRVTYAGEAQVRGDMPAGERASRTQRDRWEGGRAALTRRHALRLLTHGVRARDRVAIDLAVGLLVPPLAKIVSAIGLGLMACAAYSWWVGTLTGVIWLWVACGAALLAHVGRAWRLSETGGRGLRALAYAPFYVAWKLTLRLRPRTHGRGEWVRTARGEESP